jgi:hypothetical protein
LRHLIRLLRVGISSSGWEVTVGGTDSPRPGGRLSFDIVIGHRSRTCIELAIPILVLLLDIIGCVIVWCLLFEIHMHLSLDLATTGFGLLGVWPLHSAGLLRKDLWVLKPDIIKNVPRGGSSVRVNREDLL